SPRGSRDSPAGVCAGPSRGPHPLSGHCCAMPCWAVDKLAGPTLRDIVIPHRHERRLSPPGQCRQFFPSRSFSTTLSSMVLANRRLGLAFSSPRAFSLSASDTSMPPYLDLNL